MTKIFYEVREGEVRKTVDTETMVENLHANMKRGLPALRLRRACVIGGGPSLNDHEKDVFDDVTNGFTVIALNGAAKWLFERGITPDIQVFYDARPENAAFITPKHAKLYLVASHVSPAVLDALEGRNVQLFHAHAAGPLLDEIKNTYPGSHILGGATTVGLQTLNMLVVSGFRHAKFYGYDSCNRDGAHHAYSQPLNDDEQPEIFRFRSREYSALPAMAMQARDFSQIAGKYERMGLKIEVIGDGLLRDMWLASKETPA